MASGGSPGSAAISVGTVDPSGTVHTHVSQINMTDWEFLRARAREIGFTVAVRDGKLAFRRRRRESGPSGSGRWSSGSEES